MREFKQDAVRLLIEHGYTQPEAGRNLEINAKMPGRWIQEFRADASEAFRGNGKRMAEQE
jgi:transposase-like protein